jgi:hypothetical protein
MHLWLLVAHLWQLLHLLVLASPLMDSVLDRFTGRARELMLERGGFIQPFAEGGVVTSPMMGIVGEAGSEAIIPLDRLRRVRWTNN